MIGGKPKQLFNPARPNPNAQCQKCLKRGHMTYQCTNSRPYQARPSRSEELKKGIKPRDKPSVEIPEEFKSKKGIADRILAEKEAERTKEEAKKDRKDRKTKKKTSSSGSSSDSDSDSNDDSESDASSSSSSSSRSPPRRRPRSASPRRRRRSSTFDSDSDSDDVAVKDTDKKAVKQRKDGGSGVRRSSSPIR